MCPQDRCERSSFTIATQRACNPVLTLDPAIPAQPATQLDMDGAIVCYEEALRLSPDEAWLLDAYASLLADLGKIDEAQEMFEKSVEIDPGGSHVKYMYLGECVFRLRSGREPCI